MFRNFGTRKPLGVSLEDDTPEVPDESTGPVEPGVDQLEQDLLEGSEELGEGIDNDAQVDEAVEASSEIEDAVEVAEASEDKGGLDVPAAESLRILVNSACRRAGISPSGSMPAMESFGQTGRRLSNTRIAVEDWKDKIKEVWVKIVAALKRAYEWFIGYVNKVFGGAEKLKKRAEALQKKASDLKGRPEGELKNSTLAKALALGGKFSGAGSVITGLPVLNQAVSTLNTEADTMVKNGDTLAVVAGDAQKLKGYNYEGKVITGSAGDAYGSAKEGWGFKAGGELLGGMTLLEYGPSTKPAPGVAALAAMARATLTIAPFGGKLKEVSGEDLSIASPSEIEDIAKSAAKVADDAISFRAASKKLGDTLKKVVDAASKASASAEKSDEDADKANRELFKACKEAYASQTKHMASDPAKIVTYVVRAASSAVQYGEASAAKYK